MAEALSETRNLNVPARPTKNMRVNISFHSYFKELTGCHQAVENLPTGSTIADLLKSLQQRFPQLAAMQNSTLIAVGVEYQNRSYILKENEEVSFFPPVQGG